MPAASPPSKWTALSSSAVSAARWDPGSSPGQATGTLSVLFKSGRAYDYVVPPDVAAGLFSASSPGRYVRDVLSGFSYAEG
jgi:hypothetical protein